MSYIGQVVANKAEDVLVRYSMNAPGPKLDRLLELDKAGEKELRSYMWERFLHIFEHAYRTVPYYKEVYERAGVSPQHIKSFDDLQLIPTVTKPKISANFPDRITSEDSDRNTWTYIATSGTTSRLMVIHDYETFSENTALGIYKDIIRGTYFPGALLIRIPPDVCSMACAVNTQRSKTIKDRFAQMTVSVLNREVRKLPRTIAGRVLRRLARPIIELPSFGSTGTQVSTELLDWYVETIRRLEPKVLSGLPTFLQIIARHIKKSGAPIPLVGSLLPQGSLSNPSLQMELSDVFNAPVHEEYGSHELGAVASTCEKRDRLHVNMPGFLVEVVRDGKHVPPGELGEIVITSFINAAMPLIRYKPGDVGRLYDDKCSCGRNSQLLSIEGRLQDTVVTSKGVFTSQLISEHFAKERGIEFFQLVQRDGIRFDLQIVETEKGSIAPSELAGNTQDFLGPETQVRVRQSNSIKPEVSGKFRFVKSASFEKFSQDPFDGFGIDAVSFEMADIDDGTEEILEALFE